MLKTLYRGDPGVLETLGKQIIPEARIKEEGERASEIDIILKPTIYSVKKYVDGCYLIYHVLTRGMYLVPSYWIEYLVDDYRDKLDLTNETQKELFQNWFLVDISLDETQLYQDTRKRLLDKNQKCINGSTTPADKEISDSLHHFTILPTSSCNARCTYCFEEGMPYLKMSSETVDATVKFIVRQAMKLNEITCDNRPVKYVKDVDDFCLPEDTEQSLTREKLEPDSAKPVVNNRIQLSWFGGEPLCAPDNIDRICQSLIEAGISFDSDMISNGSLFSEEMACRAVEVWHLREVQITLDGLEKEYVRRKRYVSSVIDPFGTVIRNIHILLRKEIRVIIRLNLDYKNVGQLFLLIDYLNKEFSADTGERKFLYVYSEPIKYDLIDSTDEVQQLSRDLHYYIEKAGFLTSYGVNLQRLRLNYCMADAPRQNIVICSDGSLNVCDHLPDSMAYGDVFNGITKPDVWEGLNSLVSVPGECRNCNWLPECTPFMKAKCPNRVIDCKARMRRFFDEGINRAYSEFRMNEELHRNGAIIFIKLADLIIEIRYHYRYVVDLCHDYIIWDEMRKEYFEESLPETLKSDIFIEISDEELDQEIDREKNFLAGRERGYVEAICIYEKLSLELFRFDAFIMHSAVIEIDGKAFCFAAKSGIGKTTHTRYWKQKYPQTRVINGDKPIYRIVDGVVRAYGTPWCGKEGWNENISAPLRGLCLLEQGQENSIELINGFQHLNRIMNQFYLPSGKGNRIKLMEILDILMEKVPIYRLTVRQETEAAAVAHEVLIG